MHYNLYFEDRVPFCLLRRFQSTFTESNIRGGFRGTGLAPFNPDNVISKLDVQLRTPTPLEEAAKPSTPWTSKTPTTASEAQSQSE
jgi:hypothetical protein